jgi:putative transposase
MSQHPRPERITEINFRNRFRIPSARLSGWDYASEGYYFVTICVKDRLTSLAKIIDGDVLLSPIGEIIAEEWKRTAEIRKNVKLDAWVIMPDHVHGIIGIVPSDNLKFETPRRNNIESPHRKNVETPRWDDVETPHWKNVETLRRGVSKPNAAAYMAWKSDSLGSIIGQFKSKSTKRIRGAGYCDFAWQMRFYDHIIRDNDDLERVRRYIRENPGKWGKDRNQSEKCI